MSRPQAEPVPHPRVVLFTRPGCHLCDDAREVVRQVCADTGQEWVEVDIEGDPSGSLVGRYGDYVPVVEVDGVQQGFWRVDAARLARRLAGGARGRERT
ncbi:glutaredoxin family protein [Isoptericola variabilis]|uniref:glutaredoxin family protein n=1 Tax=Isoptericola variabilis TaxID=139208 RepID=UPI00117E5626|nr:glutaredoxin family protein [Isoptericola variabilis]